MTGRRAAGQGQKVACSASGAKVAAAAVPPERSAIYCGAFEDEIRVNAPRTRLTNLVDDIGDLRLVLPGVGCMWCNGLIDPTELAIDMHPESERRAARYVEDVPAPSVIALDALVAAEAVNHFMLAAVGLHFQDDDYANVLYRSCGRNRDALEPAQQPSCPWCSARGALALGD